VLTAKPVVSMRLALSVDGMIAGHCWVRAVVPDLITREARSRHHLCGIKMWGVDQGSEFSSHRLGFAGRDTAEMVFDLVVLRIVGCKD